MQCKVGDKVLAKSEWKEEKDSLSYEVITDIISTPNAKHERGVFWQLSIASLAQDEA